MADIKGNIKLVFEEGLEVEYSTELTTIWLIKKGSILKFSDSGIIEILELDTYFKEKDDLVTFLIVAHVKLLM